MREVESELSRGEIAARRIDLETAKDNFLQPRGITGPKLAWRHRVPPQSPIKAALASGIAEWPDASREEVEQHAERKQIAAGVPTHAKYLLGRHVGSSSVRHAELRV